MPVVDTRRSVRRAVAYDSLDAIVADAQRLVDAGATTTGNWSLAQILEHLATAMDYQVDGFPPELTFNPVLRFFVRTMLKKRFLTRGVPSGYKLKGRAATALIKEQSEVEAAAALDHLRRAAERFKAATKSADHGAFGPMTKAEAELLQRRHAELHMSFVAEAQNGFDGGERAARLK